MVIGAPYKDNVHGPNERAVYTFTMQGKTLTEDKILTASDGESSNYLGGAFLLAEIRF